MIQLESFHSITILANLRRLYFIVITDPRNTTVRSVTLEYVGQTFRGHIRSQAFRPEGNSFLSGELRYIDGSACDKGTPGTPPPLKQAAIPLALLLLMAPLASQRLEEILSRAPPAHQAGSKPAWQVDEVRKPSTPHPPTRRA